MDGVRAGVASQARLLRSWGVVGAVVALDSIVESFGDPLAARVPLLSAVASGNRVGALGATCGPPRPARASPTRGAAGTPGWGGREGPDIISASRG